MMFPYSAGVPVMSTLLVAICSTQIAHGASLEPFEKLGHDLGVALGSGLGGATLKKWQNLVDNTKDTIVYGLQPSCRFDRDDEFNMCLDLASPSGTYERWMDSFLLAKKRWERIIVGDLPSRTSYHLPTRSTAFERLACTGYPNTIDDVYICGVAKQMDGPGGILAQAARLYGRGTGVMNNRTGNEYQVALSGIMEFDSADIQNLVNSGELDEVVFHEMAHVLGSGSGWRANGLKESHDAFATNTHADDEWKALGCTGPVPIETDGPVGTAGYHWDEACLQHELMSGYLSGSRQPVSRITIGSFEDMGYQVDYRQADPFSISDLGECGSYCHGANRGRGLRSNTPKRRLSKAGHATVLKYAKHTLEKLYKEMAKEQRAGMKHQSNKDDDDDGIEMLEDGLDVVYQDSDGTLHSVYVGWDQVKDPSTAR